MHLPIISFSNSTHAAICPVPRHRHSTSKDNLFRITQKKTRLIIDWKHRTTSKHKIKHHHSHEYLNNELKILTKWLYFTTRFTCNGVDAAQQNRHGCDTLPRGHAALRVLWRDRCDWRQPKTADDSRQRPNGAEPVPRRVRRASTAVDAFRASCVCRQCRSAPQTQTNFADFEERAPRGGCAPRAPPTSRDSRFLDEAAVVTALKQFGERRCRRLKTSGRCVLFLFEIWIFVREWFVIFGVRFLFVGVLYCRFPLGSFEEYFVRPFLYQVPGFFLFVQTCVGVCVLLFYIEFIRAMSIYRCGRRLDLHYESC